MISDASYYELLWSRDRSLHSDDATRLDVTRRMVPAAVHSLLDVGAGRGDFLAVLEQHGCAARLVGLERSAAAIERKVCDCTIVQGSSNALPFADQSFDLVSACEVIEHLPYKVYQESLNEMARVARRGILISVPYREKRRLMRCPHCGCRFAEHYHLRTFNERTLTNLFPGFALVLQERVWVLRPVFHAWVTKLRDVFQAGRRAWYAGVQCPACGFHTRARASSAQFGADASLGIKNILKSRWPRAHLPAWIVSLFQRSTP